jgi:hypothetical protein
MVQTRRSKKYTTEPSPAQPPPARKVKNKVGSPSPARKPAAEPPPAAGYSSDEFAYSDYEDSSLSALPVENYNSDTSQGKRAALNPILQKELLTDIQKHGGLQAFRLRDQQALSHLCNLRPEVYGTRGDALRKKIRNKVRKWLELDETEWLGVLVRNKVSEKPGKLEVPTPSKRQKAEKGSTDKSKRQKAEKGSTEKSRPETSDSESGVESEVSDKKLEAKSLIPQVVTVQGQAKKDKDIMSYPPNTRK